MHPGPTAAESGRAPRPAPPDADPARFSYTGKRVPRVDTDISERNSSDTERRTMRPASSSATGRAASACLVVLRGQRLGQRLDLGDQPVVIGRAPECDFQIMERSVSRQHARIWKDPAGYRIKDLGSTNRILLNDQPVIEAELGDGDQITIGANVLKFMERSSIEARYHEEIYQLATVDPLTNLCNRRHFLELAERELARAAVNQHPPALLIIDLDRFKQINDTHGHDVGDLVLRQAAAALAASAPDDAITARIGGEEFAVLLPDRDIAAAVEVAERLRGAVAELDFPDQPGVAHVTASIGAARWNPAMTDITDLLRAADKQLYAAKSGGRDRVCAEAIG